MLSQYDREVFAIININAKGQALNMHIVSIGDLCSSVTHPREVFKSSVLSNAGSVIAIHNHPSGDPTPSDVDIETTRRLSEAGNILGIPLLDHIIIGDNKYVCEPTMFEYYSEKLSKYGVNLIKGERSITST